MEIQCLNSGSDILEFTINGELNTYEVENFQEAIQSQITDTTKALILDMTKMPYVTSAGLRSICIMGRTVMKNNLKFVICGLNGLSKEIYFVSGFHQVFPPSENISAARELLEKNL